MEWNKQTVKQILLVVCSGVAFYCALQNLRAVLSAVGWLIGIMAPFLLGAAIAFVLNVPMRAIERHLFQGNRKRVKFRRPLALMLTLLAVIGVLTLAVNVIAPGVGNAASSVISQLPAAFERLQKHMAALKTYLPQLEALMVDLNIDWKMLSEKALVLAKNWGNSLLSTGGGLVGGVVSGVATFVIGLIFSFYILMQKETLSRHGRQVLYGLLPEQRADRVLEVLRLANRTFSGFLSGQCLEAVLLGAIFVIAMSIFRMPYALLVGVLIMVTALIPIVGAFIGCIVGAFLILVVNPMQAVWFVVMFLVIQQIEGNVIYPKVVGSSVGLPPILVFAAVIVGGEMMGVAGMLVFIPLTSVCFTIIKAVIEIQLHKKNVPAEKLR